MLALSPDLVYVHEPFNVENPHALFPGSVDRWYKYLAAGDPNEALRSAWEHVFALRYPLVHRLREVETVRESIRCFYSAARYARKRWDGRSVLVKDPLALLAAEWLEEQFDLEVVVMIRHPAAFAGSLKVKNWTFPFDDLLSQPQLMAHLLGAWRTEVTSFAETERNIVDQAALLWALLYEVVLRYQDRHPNWVFLRHEDVAQAPLRTFRKLYHRFGMKFTDEIRETIQAYSNTPGSESSNGAIQRDSQSVIRNWTQRLTPTEIERVRDRTEPVASNFYTDDEW